jgi:hypothetical protein
MSIRINNFLGVWDQAKGINHTQPEKPSFLKANKGTLIAISMVAFLAIGSLAAGGLLIYLFKMNTIVAWSLLGGGGGALIIDALIGGVILYVRNRKAGEALPDTSGDAKNHLEGGRDVLSNISEGTEHDLGAKDDYKQQSTYRVVSWNVATSKDYSNMCFIKQKMACGTNLADACDELLMDAWSSFQASQEEYAARADLFRQAFHKFEDLDIICLQESWEMEPEDLKAILPEGYSTFSYYNSDGRECAIAWNTSKFSKVDHANLSYASDYISSFNSAPDTIALLKDLINGTTICVGSAHLRGFSLAYATFEEEIRRQQELYKAQAGDNQARYDLAIMDAVQADLYIFAGDLNTTDEHYPARLNIIRGHGYFSDTSDSNPTIYDANLKENDKKTPKPAKLDHIFVKGREGSQVLIHSINPLQSTPLNNFNRPSDHLPIGAEISYTRA